MLHPARFSAADQKAAPGRQDPKGQCRNPYPPLAARRTGRNRAARRGQRLPVRKSGRAAQDQNRLPLGALSSPAIFRRGGPFRLRQKSSAAALCPQAPPPLACASQARHAAAPPPGNQERRCRRRQSLVVSRQEKLSAVSSQFVAPASLRLRSGQARRLSRGRLALAAKRSIT